jgi:hypothetical protein
MVVGYENFGCCMIPSLMILILNIYIKKRMVLNIGHYMSGVVTFDF